MSSQIAIFNSKGGVGKSLFAANFAVLSQLPLLDADPQATIVDWAERRGSDRFPFVRGIALGRAHKEIASEKSGCVLDLPGANVSGVGIALSEASLIIIPVSCDPATLDALWSTVHSCLATPAKVVLVINKMHPQANAERVVRSLADQFPKVSVCPYPIRHRVRIHEDLWAEGNVCVDEISHPDQEKAASEFYTVWGWLNDA